MVVQPKQVAAQEKTTGAEGSSQIKAPTLSLPKGGGAIRGMGEKFAANPVTGKGSMTVPTGRGNMPNKRATELAKGIFDDLRGAQFYADPKILGGFVKGNQATALDQEATGVELLRYLLRKFTPRDVSDEDVKDLARVLEGKGVR